MNCFNHQTSPAVGLCKYCAKGLCPDCADTKGKYLSCKGPICELELKEIEEINEKAKKIYMIGNRKKKWTTGHLFGIFFSVFGVLSILTSISEFFIDRPWSTISLYHYLSIAMGICFILFGFAFLFKRNKLNA